MPRSLAVILCTIPWVLAVLAAIWLAILRFPPSGIFVATTVLDGKSAWILPFLPAERVSSPGLQKEGWTGQRILSDPVYFTSRVPGPYETVDVEFEFRPVHQPLVEFGMVRDAEGKNLEMRPLYSSELDADTWRVVTAGSVRGYVHTGTADARLANPDTRGLAIWAASSSLPLMQDSAAENKETRVSLRGAHDFYIVPTDRLHVSFLLQAVNRKTGNDLVSFRVFRGEEEVYREAFDLSGSQDARMGQAIEHAIDLPNVQAGVYRVSLLANDDVFIRKVTTPSARWVVGPRLVFGDVVGYATSTMPGRVWTNTRHAVVETFHTEGLQEVALGGARARIQKTHTTVRIDREDAADGPAVLYAPQGDVRIIGDGFFAFTPDAFFEPSPRRLTSNTMLEKEHIQAVVTSYQRPEKLREGWYRARASFALDARLDTARFVFSAPGVLARGSAVDIRRITLTYHRAAISWRDWVRTLRQELSNAWHRL